MLHAQGFQAQQTSSINPPVQFPFQSLTYRTLATTSEIVPTIRRLLNILDKTISKGACLCDSRTLRHKCFNVLISMTFHQSKLYVHRRTAVGSRESLLARSFGKASPKSNPCRSTFKLNIANRCRPTGFSLLEVSLPSLQISMILIIERFQQVLARLQWLPHQVKQLLCPSASSTTLYALICDRNRVKGIYCKRCSATFTLFCGQLSLLYCHFSVANRPKAKTCKEPFHGIARDLLLDEA